MSGERPLWESRPGGEDIRPASQPEARRVRDFIWLSEGLSNAFLVTTDAGRVVINTGMGFEAPVHRRNFDAVDASPIRYVLLTQAHVDHVGGVDLFLEEGTEVVAQAGNPAHQADDARLAAFRARRSAFAFADAIARANRYVREHFGDAVAPQARPTPTLTFEDRLEFTVGGRRFELLHTPGGETTESMVVWLPESGACFAGNLFGALFGHVPNLVTLRGDRHRDALRFVASLERVLALEPELLLVGHHAPVEGRAAIRSELLRLRGAVLHLHDEVVRGMNAGRDVFTLMRDVRLPAELAVGEGYGKVSWNVRAIWEGYAGWFHARSTTELYGVPPAAAAAELAALLGPDATARAARGRLEEGEAPRAIALAEAALGADPMHRGALEVALEAHLLLESESRNFWERAWLRREIARLRGALEG